MMAFDGGDMQRRDAQIGARVDHRPGIQQQTDADAVIIDGGVMQSGKTIGIMGIGIIAVILQAVQPCGIGFHDGLKHLFFARF